MPPRPSPLAPLPSRGGAGGGVPPKPAPRLRADAAKRRSALHALAWLVWTVARAAPRPCALWAAAALGLGLLVPAELWLTKALVDALVARLHGGGGRAAFLWLGLLVAALLLQRLLGGAQPWLQASVRERAGAAIQERALRKAAELDLAAFEHQGYYDQLHAVLADAETRAPRLLQQALQVLQLLPTFLGYAAALAALTPLLVLIVLAAWLPTARLWGSSGQYQWNVLRGQSRERRLADYYATLLTGRAFAQEVRLYGLADELLTRWSALFRQSRAEQRRALWRVGLRLRGAGAAANLAVALGLWGVIAAGLLGHPSAGALTLLFQSIGGLIHGVFQLSSAVQALGEQAGYAAEFRAFTDIPTEGDAGQETAGDAPPAAAPVDIPSQRTPTPEAPRAPRLAFEDVWFTYPGGAAPALAGVSFVIEAGEKVALVGENGAGKTTLVKLLLGLYRPDAGRITVDGVDARELAPNARRAAASAVFQQFVRYPLTLAGNIGVSQPERLADRPRLEAAAEQAGLEEIAQSLPQSYDTLLGPDVGGVDLSGGQWQRVALARGVFRGASLLALDEPTAALDPLAELALFTRFAALAQGRTALLISHRLGMARLADRVLVLANGKLVEAGPHAALLAAGGAYAALFRAQARWYA